MPRPPLSLIALITSLAAAAFAILAVGAHQPTYAALLGVTAVASLVLALVNAEAERARGRDG